MLRATFKSLAARKLRLAMSAFAIILGVAFVAGSFVFTDTLDSTFEEIFGDSNSDIVVRPTLGEGDQFEFTGGDARTLPASLADELEDVDGGSGPPGLGTNWTDAPAEDGSIPLQIVDGEEPAGPAEVVLDTATADEAGYQVGDTVTLVMPGDPPQLRATMVGTAEFGGGDSLAGATLTLFDTTTAQDLLLGGENVYNNVAVTTDDDADVADVRASIEQSLPDDVEAKTGAEVA